MRFHELFDLKPIQHAPINRTTHLLDDKDDTFKKYDGSLRKQILCLLHDEGPMATFEVSDALKCNPPTAKAVLADLAQKNLIRSLPKRAKNVPSIWERI